MVDVKQAADRALEYMRTLYPEGNFPGIRLEEVELDDSEQFWYITLSYVKAGSLSTIFPDDRDYKIFKIRASNGEVISMKIRKVK